MSDGVAVPDDPRPGRCRGWCGFVTCCKLPSAWRWRLRTLLGGYGDRHALFFCEHGHCFKLTRYDHRWFWRQLHDDGSDRS